MVSKINVRITNKDGLILTHHFLKRFGVHKEGLAIPSKNTECLCYSLDFKRENPVDACSNMA